jgi:nitrate/nitrite-specific signal transduction histidine kinase
VLVDSSGDILFHPGREQPKGTFLPDKTLREVVAAKQGWRMVSETAYHDQETFIAYSTLQRLKQFDWAIDWIVFISQDANEVFAPLRRLIFQMIFMLCLLLLLVVLNGMVFSGMFVRPLKKIRRATREIGEGDFDCKVSVDTGDEIEDLADSLNVMSEKLRESRNQLKEQSNQLAEKVRERTKGLQRTNERLQQMYKEREETLKKLGEVNQALMRTKEELENKLAKLEQFSRVSVGRELRMRELKEKIKILEARVKMQERLYENNREGSDKSDEA